MALLMTTPPSGIYPELTPFANVTNFHRLHVVPPCTITADEAREGLARLDRAISAIDKYYVGDIPHSF